jgi:hypothetical protein
VRFDDLAKRWAINTSTVARWLTDGIGPAFVKIGAQVRYRVQDVEQYEVLSLKVVTDQRASPMSDRCQPQA